jgi:excisionase family DNA binding protein
MPQERREEWLRLTEASRVVGVDPDTLRRWADRGEITVFTTPGGHRRFARAALERITATRRASPVGIAKLGATPERLSAAYRRSYGRRGPAPVDPRGAVEPADREPFRQDGRRLVEVLLAYLDASEPGAKAAAEEEAGRLSADLAARLQARGVELTDAITLFVAARRPFLAELSALARRRRLDADQFGALYESAASLLDRLLIGFIAAHRAGGQS